jgi:hypothetical protein
MRDGATVTFNGSTESTITDYTAKAVTDATIFEGSAALAITTLTDTVGSLTKVTFNGTGTKTIAAYTAKVTDNATTFDGDAALIITELADIGTGATTVIFNGTGGTTIAALEPLDDGLTIAGDGAVRLTVPTLTNGLAVTNTAGVTMPSADIPAEQSIDASDGKVIFGTSTNSVTIENGALASSETALVTVAENGVITVPYDSDSTSLTLYDEGTLVITGTGSVTVGGTLEITGDGTTLTSDGISTITAGDNSTATLATDDAADGNGIQIGTAENGVALLANSNAVMRYAFTASTGEAPVSVTGAHISIPADGTTIGAIFEATIGDKAKIVLGTASGGFSIAKGDHGGQFKIIADSGGSKIGPFGETSNENGNPPATLGLNEEDAQSDGEKILLGSYSGGFSTVGSSATVTAIGTTGSGNVVIDHSVVLDET